MTKNFIPVSDNTDGDFSNWIIYVTVKLGKVQEPTEAILVTE